MGDGKHQAMHRHITKQPDCSHGKNIMPEPSKSDSECIAGLELPKQDNAHAPHPVSAAIIYAGVFTMTCALYSSILSACWGFLLIILPGYAIVPFIALLLTRKINASDRKSVV